LIDRELLICIEKLFKIGIIQQGACIDIGSNIGNHSIFFSKAFEKVLAFEPLAELLPLADNIALNRIDNIKVFPFGLSSRPEDDACIFISPVAGMGASTLIEGLARDESSRKLIRLERGDDALRDAGKISLIKIDVEGYEAEVLKGLEKTIDRDRPVIVFEWNNQNTKNEFLRLNIFPSILKKV